MAVVQSLDTMFTVVVLVTLDLAIAIIAMWGGISRPYHGHAGLEFESMPPAAINVQACRARFKIDAEYCQLSSSTAPLTTVLLGDSHAAHWFTGLSRRVDERHEAVALLGQSGCPPLAGLERQGVSGLNRCVTVNDAIVSTTLRDPAIRHVLISFRGTTAVTGEGYGRVESDLHVVFRDLTAPQVGQPEAIRRALLRTVTQLLNSHKDVSVILPVPELGFSIQDCLGRPVSFAHLALRQPCAVPRADVVARQQTYRDIVMDAKRAEPRLRVVDPLDIFCDAALCWGIRDGAVLYIDTNHISVAASQRGAAAIVPPAF